MNKLSLLFATLALLTFTGCNDTQLSTQQVSQARQAARYFLSGIETGKAGWACNNSTPDYWLQAAWTKDRQASFAKCIQGFKQLFRTSPLDATDHAQYVRMLNEVNKVAITGKGQAAEIKFTDMKNATCKSSQMELHQDGVPWKVTNFVQGRCFGLIK